MRNCCRLFLAAMMCLPAMVRGGTLSVTITTTIAVQDPYSVFIVCNDVLAVSCNQNALFPLISIQGDKSAPAFPNGVTNNFNNINFSSLWSGYITFIALPQDSSSDVVVALRNGFITAGSPWPFSTPESQIAADLLGGSQAQQTDLTNFFLNNLSAFSQIGSQDAQNGTFWKFSNAVAVGSLSTTPEPSTITLMAPAVLALALRSAISRVKKRFSPKLTDGLVLGRSPSC
jgi:hypothetical protein